MFLPVTLRKIASRVVAGLRAPIESSGSGTISTDAAIAAAVEPEPIESLDELVVDMLDDYQVCFTLDVLIASIKRAEVSITLNSGEKSQHASDGEEDLLGIDSATEPDDELAKAVAADLQRLWADTLPKLLDKRDGVLSYGRCAFEKIIENDLEQGITRIRMLDLLPPVDKGIKATKMKLTKQGDFDGIELTIGGKSIQIPAELSWWCAIGATKLKPYGRSLFLGAPSKVREQRKKLFKLTDAFIRRWAIKPPTVHAPATAKDINGQVIDNHKFIAGVMQKNFEYGNPIILPNARDMKTGNFETDITSDSETLNPSPITEIADMLDAQQSRAFGVHEKITSEGSEVGSHAAQLMHVAIMLSICDGIVSELTNSFAKYVGEKVVTMNWAMNAPKLTVQAVSLLSDAFVMELANSLLTSPQWSPLMVSGAVNIESILLSSGVPLSADFKVRLEKALEIARQQKQQLPPAGQAGADDEEIDDTTSLDTEDDDPLFSELAVDDEDDAYLLSAFKGRGGGKGTNQYGIKGKGASRSKKNGVASG